MADVNKRLREEISYLSRLINTHKKQEINQFASKAFAYQCSRSKGFRNTLFGYSSYPKGIIQSKSFRKTNVDRVVKNQNGRINPYKIDRTVKDKFSSVRNHSPLPKSISYASSTKSLPSTLQNKVVLCQNAVYNRSVMKPEVSSFIPCSTTSNAAITQERILVTVENKKSSEQFMSTIKKLPLGTSKTWAPNSRTVVKCIAKPSAAGLNSLESNVQRQKLTKSNLIMKSKYKLINSEKEKFKGSHNHTLCSKVRTGKHIFQTVQGYSSPRWKVHAKRHWKLSRMFPAYHSQYASWKNSYCGYHRISVFNRRAMQRKRQKIYFSASRGKLNPSACEVVKCSAVQPKMVMIGGLLYKASKMKLSRASKSSGKQTTQKHKSLGLKLQTLLIRGVRYQMDPSGMTLKRISSQPLKGSPAGAIKQGPKRIDLGGSTYIQTQPGILTKTESAQTRTFVSRVVNRSICRVLAATEKKVRSKNNMYCMFYNRFGRCNKGDQCPYKHDPDKVAVCMRFLRGTCKVVDCPFSHKVAPEKMPVCSFYLQGRCNNDSCPYRHVKVSRSAEVCKDFLRGYCPASEKCKKIHTLVCQEYAVKGNCKNRSKCPMHHPIKKSQKKKGSEFNSSLKSLTPETSKQQCTQSASALPKPYGHIDSSKISEPLPSFIALGKDEKEDSLPIKPASTVKREALRIRPNFLSKGTLGATPSVPGK